VELAELQKWIDIGRKAIKADSTGKLFSEYSQTFLYLFGRYPSSCDDNCQQTFTSDWKEFENFYKQKLINPNMEPIKCDFKIKGGGILNTQNGGYSQSEINNDLILTLLKEGVVQPHQFDEMPKDWEKQLESAKTHLEIAQAAQANQQKANPKTEKPSEETADKKADNKKSGK
jgi:hypothetical protein